MSKFSEDLWSDLVREHGHDVEAPVQTSESHRLLRRPRIVAGGSLGLAGVAAALVVALSGSAAPPAFAVTRQADGSVLVTVNTKQRTQPWVEAADEKLAAKGFDEAIGVKLAPGPAASKGPVSCTPQSVLGKRPPGPPVKVLLGTDGTDVIPSGTTGAGTVHLVSCYYYDAGPGWDNTGPAR